jgi:hypothetical protein
MGPNISLNQNVAQFWAVRGQARSVQINYQSGTDASYPFLQFAASDPVYVPGVGDLAVGDSVLITVSVDTTNLKVSFEPTGLKFGTASQLQIWYGGAGGDLNGDGLVDSTDARIERQLLGLWTRENPTDPWGQLPATQSLSDKSFLAALQQFCEFNISFTDYAVSW